MSHKNIVTSSLAIAASLLMLVAGNIRGADKPLDIGARRELFVDDFLIEKLNGARLHLHTPPDEGIAFRLTP